MSSVIIFIPSSLQRKGSGEVLGVVQYYEKENVNNFYILDVQSSVTSVRQGTNEHEVIGKYWKETTDNAVCKSTGKKNWVSFGKHKNEFSLFQLISNGENIELHKPCRVISVIYDYKMFMESELFLFNYETRSSEYVDYFKNLMIYIKSECRNSNEQTKNSIVGAVFVFFLSLILNVVDSLLRIAVFMDPVLRYSSLGLQVRMFLESLSWALHHIADEKKVSLKVGNFIFATIVDTCSGVLLLYWCLGFLMSSPSQSLLDSAEVVVTSLRDLLKWVMGIPAGLKLNFAFNNMLGKFFLYHINLWWTFLVVTQPLLELTFQVFLCLGRLGLTFQAAILADLLAIASFHVYCIYVYAARLYNLQVSGLVALWRLFLGRKHNPLRGRVDSCKYSADQLFIGTLAFTILLFLLPTTFIYYVLFAVLRLMVVGLGGLLTRIRFLLQVLPLYSTCLWCVQPSAVSTSLHLVIRSTEKGSPLTLSASPVVSSWWNTSQQCVPETVKNPPNVAWGTLLRNLVTGHLIYPV